MKFIKIAAEPENLQALLDEFDYDTIYLMKGCDTVAMLSKDRGDCSGLIGSMKDDIKINGDVINVGDRWVKGRQW